MITKKGILRVRGLLNRHPDFMLLLPKYQITAAMWGLTASSQRKTQNASKVAGYFRLKTCSYLGVFCCLYSYKAISGFIRGLIVCPKAIVPPVGPAPGRLGLRPITGGNSIWPYPIPSYHLSQSL